MAMPQVTLDLRHGNDAVATAGPRLVGSYTKLEPDLAERSLLMFVASTKRAFHRAHADDEAADATVFFYYAQEPEPDPGFPFRHRTDLPKREREISATSLSVLYQGISDARSGLVSEVPPSVYEDEDDE